MEQFLDSCVIIHYSNYLDENSKKIIKKCFDFVESKKDKFILCYFALQEIYNFKKRRIKVHKEVIRKLQNPQYDFGKELDFRSISFAKQLYAAHKGKDIVKVSEYLKEQRRTSDYKIEQFLIKILDERAIPIQKIDSQLVNKINDIISNHADCKILASALQLQKERELFLFVTADDDFNENGYNYLVEHFEINHSNDGWKFPDLKNLLSEN